jgi:hypothetical protein
MFDVIGNHKYFIKRFNYGVKSFLLKLKIFLILPKMPEEGMSGLKFSEQKEALIFQITYVSFPIHSTPFKI